MHYHVLGELRDVLWGTESGHSLMVTNPSFLPLPGFATVLWQLPTIAVFAQ